MKERIDAGEQRRNDMWCHFGTVVIRDMDEGLFVCLFVFLTCTASITNGMIPEQESELYAVK